jgi:hypothetical protein
VSGFAFIGDENIRFLLAFIGTVLGEDCNGVADAGGDL